MIIAFSGKARSGKTTAAIAVQKMFPKTKPTAILSFAHPLKSMVTEEFGHLFSPEDLKNNKGKKIRLGDRDWTLRGLLIRFGNMYRELEEDFWINKLMKHVRGLSDTCDIAIDDVRYPNELRILRENGAKIVRIERPGVELIDDPSETLLDTAKFDAVVHNDGDKDSFRERVRAIPFVKSLRTT